MSDRFVVVGGGVGALMVAVELARRGAAVDLLAPVHPVRWPAPPEGGINDGARPEGLLADTVRAGRGEGSSHAVFHMVARAPALIDRLARLGVPFATDRRRLAGSSAEHARYVEAQTRHQLAVALESELLRLGSEPRRLAGGEPQVRRFERHRLSALALEGETVVGCVARDRATGERLALPARAVLLAGSGLPALTAGPFALGTERPWALALEAGALMAHVDRVQLTPSALLGEGRLRALSDALRAEGARYWVPAEAREVRAPQQLSRKERHYFLEEAHQDDLVSDEVAARALAQLTAVEGRGVYDRKRRASLDAVYLDISHLPESHLMSRLASEVDACRIAARRDPAHTPLLVSARVLQPLGGLWIDLEPEGDGLAAGSPHNHATSLAGLYAFAEHPYHGACRLGGNGLLAELVAGELMASAALAYAEAREAPDPTAALERAAGAEAAELEALVAEEGSETSAAVQLELRQLVEEVFGPAGSSEPAAAQEPLAELRERARQAGRSPLESRSDLRLGLGWVEAMLLAAEQRRRRSPPLVRRERDGLRALDAFTVERLGERRRASIRAEEGST